MKSPAQSGIPQNAALSQTLDGLWQRFLPEIRERIATLESAATAIANCNLMEDQREAAHAAAHKLAGVLGAFGLTRGTELARELEVSFARESSLASDAGATLGSMAAELRALIESRKPSS